MIYKFWPEDRISLRIFLRLILLLGVGGATAAQPRSFHSATPARRRKVSHPRTGPTPNRTGHALLCNPAPRRRKPPHHAPRPHPVYCPAPHPPHPRSLSPISAPLNRRSTHSAATHPRTHSAPQPFLAPHLAPLRRSPRAPCPL